MKFPSLFDLPANLAFRYSVTMMLGLRLGHPRGTSDTSSTPCVICQLSISDLRNRENRWRPIDICKAILVYQYGDEISEPLKAV